MMAENVRCQRKGCENYFAERTTRHPLARKYCGKTCAAAARVGVSTIVTCARCGGAGHYAKRCKQPR